MTTSLEQIALDISLTIDIKEITKKLAEFGLLVMMPNTGIQKEIISLMTMTEEELIQKLDSIYTHQKSEMPRSDQNLSK